MTLDEAAIVPEISEPLEQSAGLALEWSRQYCEQARQGDAGCSWYHGSWQTLRLIGLFHSIRSDDDFFCRELQSAVASGARKFLVSGAADYALLVRIATAACAAGVNVKVTVLDRCATPLKLNKWYGAKAGVDVTTVRANILDYSPETAFDVVCAHSFLCFFSPAGRQKLLKTWWDCLAPGGIVLTAQRVRQDDNTRLIRYGQAEVDQLAKKAQQLAGEVNGSINIDIGLARELAHGYAKNHWTYCIRTSQGIKTLFEQQGFGLEHLAPPGTGQPVPDIPGTPNTL